MSCFFGWTCLVLGLAFCGSALPYFTPPTPSAHDQGLLTIWEGEHFWHLRYASVDTSIGWHRIAKTEAVRALLQEALEVLQPTAAWVTQRNALQAQQVVLHRVFRLFFAPLFGQAFPAQLQVVAPHYWQRMPLGAMVLHWDAHSKPRYWLERTQFRFSTPLGAAVRPSPVIASAVALAPFHGQGLVSWPRLPYSGLDLPATTATTLWHDQTATAARLRAALLVPEQLVHVATHATADPARLWLADGSEGAIALDQATVAQWQVRSGLVVLATCESGAPAGPAGISWGETFRQAGAQRVVAHAMALDERAGHRIMRGFYTHLASKMEVAGALTRAQLDYFRQADSFQQHPFFWSGWQVLGEAGEPRERAGRTR